MNALRLSTLPLLALLILSACSSGNSATTGSNGGSAAAGGTDKSGGAPGPAGGNAAGVGGKGGSDDGNCGEGTHDCGGECLSNTDPASCGEACSACPEPPYTEATCDGSACGVVCVDGFMDCDGSPETGCEVDISNPTACAKCPSLAPCCGNGDIEGSEECDGSSVGACSTGTCSSTCKCAEACPRLYVATEQPHGICGLLTDENGMLLEPAFQGLGPSEPCGPGSSKTCVGCGYLYIGGGDGDDVNVSKVDRMRIPENVTMLYETTSCTDPTNYVLGPSAGQGDVGCTLAGCPFGPPLPASANGARCIVSTLKEDATGAINPQTGEMTLNLTLQAQISTSPCPTCVQGKCYQGPSHGAECASTNTLGTTLDCMPEDTSLTLDVVLTGQAGLTTNTSTMENGDGLFCDFQTYEGAFRQGTATKVVEYGKKPDPEVAAALLSGGTAPVTLASTFCIAALNDLIVDPLAGLPGPGAMAMRAVVKFIDAADPCGDGTCDALTEDCSSCSLDCNSCCGDKQCSAEESCESCELDCGLCPGVCGDNYQDWNEKCDGTAGHTECVYGCMPDCQTCVQPVLYGIHEKTGADQLVKIDPVAGTGAAVQTLSGSCLAVSGMAWSKSGRTMYGIHGGAGGAFCDVNLTNAATTWLFNTQVDAAAGLANDPTKSVLWYEEIFTVNQAGPSLLEANAYNKTIQGSGSLAFKLDSLTFVGNVMYGLSAIKEKLYKVASNGTLTEVSTHGLSNMFAMATNLLTNEVYAVRIGANDFLYKMPVTGGAPTRVHATNQIGFNKVKAIQFGPP